MVRIWEEDAQRRFKELPPFLETFDWYFDPINYNNNSIEEFRNQFHASMGIWYEYTKMGIKSNRKYKVRFYRNK
jgi:hypothetical protein